MYVDYLLYVIKIHKIYDYKLKDPCILHNKSTYDNCPTKTTTTITVIITINRFTRNEV